MGKMSNEQKILAEFLISSGLKSMQPKELMEVCMVTLVFVAIAFRKKDLTRLDTLDVLKEKLTDEFNWAFDQEGPQEAHWEVLKEMAKDD